MGDENFLQLPASSELLHAGYSSKVLRSWQCRGKDEVTPKNLMWPVFVIGDDDKTEEVPSLPGVNRVGVNVLMEQVEAQVRNGLTSILLFSVIDSKDKDPNGAVALTDKNPMYKAIRRLKAKFGNDLAVACDVCLCMYTSHGHCAVLREGSGLINNDATIKVLAELAVAFASAGADIVAPSDMMDGRVAAIKAGLRGAGLGNKVPVLSYSVKFASCFYGPFRDVAASAPSFGDRKCYQLPPGSSGLGMRAASRDVDEGADMLMVKPGMPYLDMVAKVRQEHPNHPLFVYQVSGEYAMLWHASKAGTFKLEMAVMEAMTSFRRAGADVVITYFAPHILDWINGR